MIDRIKLIKTENLAEETEKRVRSLESASSKIEKVREYSETITIKIGDQNTLQKNLEIYCKEQTGVILRLQLSTGTLTMKQVVVSFNKKRTAIYKSVTSLDEEILFIANSGKNLIKIQSSFATGEEKLNYTCTLKVVGEFSLKEQQNEIALLGQKYLAHYYADSVALYDAQTLERVIGFLSAKEFRCALIKDDKVAVLKKTFDDECHLMIYSKDTFDLESNKILSEKYSSSAIRKTGDFYTLYFLKGNYVYERYYTAESTYSQTKLPFKAKKISVISGNENDYLTYTDLNDNFVISVIKKDEPFKKIESFTFGKIKNPRIYEVDSSCYLSYKCGQLVVERNIAEQGSFLVVGVGDEGVKVNGNTVIRQADQIKLI